jgi:hypothetical protein
VTFTTFAAVLGAFFAGLTLGAIVVALGATWAASQHHRNLERKTDQ